MQPGEGAFDDPAVTTEPGAVLGLAAGDHGCDPSPAQLLTMAVGVVTAVCEQALGTAPAPPTQSDSPSCVTNFLPDFLPTWDDLSDLT